MTTAARTSKERPAEAPASVDHALRLASLLQLEGQTTVTEAARRLGVSTSTAHRLLSVLAYRDFAVRDGRAYLVGPVLALPNHQGGAASKLRTAASQPMEEVMRTFDETVTLAIRTENNVRFIAEVECARALRVGHRTGMVFPAEKTSIGLALLAELDDDGIRSLYRDDAHGLSSLMPRVRAARRNGFALNRGLAEQGIVAIGIAVRQRDGGPLAGLGIAMPMSRFQPRSVQPMVSALNAAALRISASLE